MTGWQIGDVKITKVVEIEVTGGSRFILPDAVKEDVKPISWLYPHFADEEGRLKMSIHALLVEAPGIRMIVDTCLGNDKQGRNIPTWNNLQGSFLEDLKAEGWEREAVDLVMCTHLHTDHVGWNTMLVDGKWVPTFPNARYLMAKPEYAHWDANQDGQQGVVFGDSVKPVFEAGLVDLVDVDHVIADEISLIPTHGHTPGHVSVFIESQGETALITGDFVHHPCQLARPDWGSSADVDKAMARNTRDEMCARFAGTPTLIIGTHFAGPSAGYLKADGDVWRLEIG